jgi:GNAT superfamily N-acetyltransferase
VFTPNSQAAGTALFSEKARAADLSDVNRVTWLAESVPNVPTSGTTAIGYAIVLRDSRADGVTFRNPAELEKIYVRHSVQGRGTGAALVNACLAQVRDWGCDGLWLAVWEKNPRAFEFYERMGFTVVGAKTFQLGSDLQHDLVMARAL